MSGVIHGYFALGNGHFDLAELGEGLNIESSAQHGHLQLVHFYLEGMIGIAGNIEEGFAIIENDMALIVKSIGKA